jgi:hypothetical protein
MPTNIIAFPQKWVARPSSVEELVDQLALVNATRQSLKAREQAIMTALRRQLVRQFPESVQ